jgi:GDP-L-fucose synthase
MIFKNDKIYIAGHTGLVGSSILRLLKQRGFINLIYATRKELNLLDQNKVNNFLKFYKPKFVFLAAAKVGGILENSSKKAEFIYENLTIQNNVIHGSFKAGVKKMIFLGSSCIYPKDSMQPIKEDYLLSGKLEPTNEPYAIAKIAGIKLCESYNVQYGTNYISLMPSNVYGPNDNYNLQSSHFFSALLKKIYFAKIKKKKKIIIWGSGNVRRELLYVDDLARACFHFMNIKTKSSIFNIGTGTDSTIREYLDFILRKLNVKIKVIWDKSKPDGVKRKLLDISLAKKYGWQPSFTMDEGFKLFYKNFLKENV